MQRSTILDDVPIPYQGERYTEADASARRLEALRRWAVLLDSAFRVPGTSFRFGIDAIIGLIPGLGDLASPIYTIAILLEGFRRRIPAVVQARMVLNAAIDMLIGLVPLAGDVADAVWKADLRNVALLERHATRGVAPRTADYVFVFVCLALVALIAIVPIVLLVLVIEYLIHTRGLI